MVILSLPNPFFHSLTLTIPCFFLQNWLPASGSSQCTAMMEHWIFLYHTISVIRSLSRFPLLLSLPWPVHKAIQCVWLTTKSVYATVIQKQFQPVSRGLDRFFRWVLGSDDLGNWSRGCYFLGCWEALDKRKRIICICRLYLHYTQWNSRHSVCSFMCGCSSKLQFLQFRYKENETIGKGLAVQ